MGRTMLLRSLILVATALRCSAQIADELVPAGSTWRFLDGGVAPPATWVALTFDDTSWKSGPAQLGYGDGDEATQVDPGNNPAKKPITTWFRHEFVVPDASVYDSVAIELLRDDGALVFLNGVEVARSNLPATLVTPATHGRVDVGASQEKRFYVYGLDANVLVTGANILAVEVHQHGPASTDLSFDLSLTAKDEPTVVRGPYLQQGTSTGVTIRWRTVPASRGRVRYGPSPGNLTFAVDDGVVARDHEVALTGLQPGTRTYYSVGTPNRELLGDDTTSFLTAPVRGDPVPLRIWVIGDSGTADVHAARVHDAYTAVTGDAHTDLWLMLGDNAYPGGTELQYHEAVFQMYPRLLARSVLWPTRGNHDALADVYYGLFTMPRAGEAGGVPSGTEAFYAFDWGNVHFVCLDSQGSDVSVGGPMWTWLDADLSATDQEWIIAFWHHPPYSKGTHDSDNELKLVHMRENFLPLFESWGVDLVLAGHSHNYERSFLLDGHHGHSSTLQPHMVIDGGDGREAGDGAYNKTAGAHAGAVYAVVGCSGSARPAALDHPVMVHSVMVFGSLVLETQRGRIDATFVDHTGAVEDSLTLLNENWFGTYCATEPDTSGCLGTLVSSGVPSLSDPQPFLVIGDDVPSGVDGLLVYGLAPTSLPLDAGKLCVAPPFVRTPLQNSAGAGSCGGRFAFDFNAHAQSGADGALVVGTHVYCQYAYRDGGSPSGWALTNALQFTLEP